MSHAEDFLHLKHHRNAFAYQTDIFYQEIHWEIDPDNYYIKGEITYRFKSLVPNLTALVLDLSDALQVNTINRNVDALTYTHTPDQLLTIQLGKTLQPGQVDSLTINYEGVPPSNGFGSFEQGSHGNENIIWTLSEPYGGRDWWPGKMDLIDKIDSVDIFITTPLGNLAASNGELISILETDGKLVHHWRHRYPIVNYLLALSVTNYSSYKHYVHYGADSMEILNYVYPENLEDTRLATQSSVGIMEFYNEKFGLYPFWEEKYGHAQFGWGGGEEHQTMSFMGGFSFGLQAHEMAHQWFGDKVTCGSWTDIWLNEGFATYLAALVLEDISPENQWISWKNSIVNSVTNQPGGSVFVDDTTNVSRIFSGRLSYNKASYLLHMLRWKMGDEAFFQACRKYLDGAGTAYEFARTRDLQAYLEAESGQDLDEFFEDWFYGQGWPSYNLRWAQETDSVVVWLSQTTSHSSVDFFEMPVPVLLKLNGVNQIVVIDHTIQDQRKSFYIGNTNVDSIGIDPDKWLLSRNNMITEVVTGIFDPVTNDLYKVFPNPAKNSFEILPSAGITKVVLMDVAGVRKEMSVANGQVDITSIPAGLYSIMVVDSTEKIVAVKRLAILE